MNTMWLFTCCSTNTNAVFSTYEKAVEFRKKWLHRAIEEDWCYDEGEDWSLRKIYLDPKTVDEFYNFS